MIIGKQALREWWQDAFDRLPSLNYKVTSLTANGDRVFMEYVRSVDGEENMLVAEVLIVREGKIIASRVYHG
jgi:predicted SnoaL-like aldol condensation-catalyzing enzyme